MGARMTPDLLLGTTSEGALVSLTEAERQRNVLIVGPPGTGKSGLLINLVIQSIEHGQGVLLIDPDGSVVDAVASYCAKHRLHRRRPIHILDPHTAGHCLGFDPLALDPDIVSSASPDVLENLRMQIRDDAVKMISAVFDHEDTNAKPQHQRLLMMVLYALVVHRLPLTEALPLTTSRDDSGLRAALTRDLPDPNTRLLWKDVAGLPPMRVEELFASLQNRFIQVVGRPIVARMLGQQRRSLNFRKVVDEGGIILVNLRASDQFSLEASRLVGAMLISKLITSVADRPERIAKQRPFHVVVDEAPLFLTEDIEWLIDRLRKRGVHLTAAVQREGQLRKFSDGIRNALLEGCATKIIFRQNAHEGAQFFGRELFAAQYDLDQVKREAPAVVGHHREIFQGESAAEATGGSYVETDTTGISRSSVRIASESLTTSEAYSEAETQNKSTGENWSQGRNFSTQGGLSTPSLLLNQSADAPKTWGDGESAQSGGSREVGHSLSSARQFGTARSEASGRADGIAHATARAIARGGQWSSTTTRSNHEALVPDIEWLPAEFKNFQEVEHEYAVLLRQLPDRHAVVKTLTKPAVVIQTLDNPDARTTGDKLRDFLCEMVQRSAYTATDAEIAAEFADRRARLADLTADAHAARQVPSKAAVRPHGAPPPLKDDGWG
jgi:TraM recognition site of TraD and TraG